MKMVVNLKKILICILICVFLSSCAKISEINGFSMDSPYSIKGENIKNEDEIRALLNKSDSIFDAYDSSFLYTLNYKKELTKTPQNAHLFEAVKLSLKYCDEYFDISIRPYTKLWDFNSEKPAPPKEDELETAKKSVGHKNIIYTDEKITLLNDAEIELGAVAKGYMCDRVYDLIDNECIINIGGTVKSSYEKPISVAIRNPDGGTYCSFYIKKGESVSTSGSYERSFNYNGKLYHHILDPKTGISTDNNLKSVTVISDSALKSDILSTKFFVSGIENANIPDDITVIFIDKDGNITQKGNKKELQLKL